jgi:hypothetical protein
MAWRRGSAVSRDTTAGASVGRFRWHARDRAPRGRLPDGCRHALTPCLDPSARTGLGRGAYSDLTLTLGKVIALVTLIANEVCNE